MEQNWNLEDNVFKSDLNIDDVVTAIGVFEVLKKKYPNDEIVSDAIEILRDEICQIFGGSIYNNEDY
jgi:hypothetical protein